MPGPEAVQASCHPLPGIGFRGVEAPFLSLRVTPVPCTWKPRGTGARKADAGARRAPVAGVAPGAARPTIIAAAAEPLAADGTSAAPVEARMHRGPEMTAPSAVVALSLLVAGASGCAHGDLPPEVAPIAEYRMGLDDVVDVTVWKEPALSAAVPIRPDGRISLPMIGDVPAAGRTTEELRREVAERLGRYVPEPSVSVMVKEVHASRFFVLGEVAHPGGYPLNGPLTVIEAMAIAGGTTEFARTGRLVVIRRAGGVRRFRVSLDAMVDGRAPPLTLAPGDTVYVP
jgi:polysaccharide export outer membrane protein